MALKSRSLGLPTLLVNAFGNGKTEAYATYPLAAGRCKGPPCGGPCTS